MHIFFSAPTLSTYSFSFTRAVNTMTWLILCTEPLLFLSILPLFTCTMCSGRLELAFVSWIPQVTTVSMSAFPKLIPMQH